jgi:hypothetical protein
MFDDVAPKVDDADNHTLRGRERELTARDKQANVVANIVPQIRHRLETVNALLAHKGG